MTENTDAKTIGARAKAVRLGLGLQQQQIADEMGISLRAWQKMERDEGTPSGETLLTFQKVKINPGWVLTGIGPKAHHSWRDTPAGDELFIRIGDMVQEIHQQAGVDLPARGLAKAVRLVFEEVIEQLDPGADTDEIDGTISVQAAKLRRRLREAADKPGTGKRSAS